MNIYNSFDRVYACILDTVSMQWAIVFVFFLSFVYFVCMDDAILRCRME